MADRKCARSARSINAPERKQLAGHETPRCLRIHVLRWSTAVDRFTEPWRRGGGSRWRLRNGLPLTEGCTTHLHNGKTMRLKAVRPTALAGPPKKGVDCTHSGHVPV